MSQPCRAIAFSFALWVSCPLPAQNSAPSSHLVFDDKFDGDIIVNEIRVPKAGEATYTYYEALGWRGKGAGYAGIQAHPKAHLYIFSIWDHKEHTAPIRAVHRGPGTKTVGFGGEGTGLKSWNFELGWSTDVWYTLVARNWPVNDHTYYGFWVHAGDTKRWTHLVTMDVAAKATFRGGTDAFIEDWSRTGARPRTTHLRGGWKRRTDGTWFPFGRGRYSVNAWDLRRGKQGARDRIPPCAARPFGDGGRFGGQIARPLLCPPRVRRHPGSALGDGGGRGGKRAPTGEEGVGAAARVAPARPAATGSADSGTAAESELGIR